MRKRVLKKSEVLREGYIKGLKHAQRIINEMLDHDEIPTKREIDWMLWEQVQKGNVSACKRILASGADANFSADYENAPIHFAAKNGLPELCVLLCRYGAKVNQPNAEGLTPMHLAAMNGHTEVCEVLNEYKGKCVCKDKDGALPLHLAAKNGHLDTCEFLMIDGRDTNLKDNEGNTPLHYAAESGNIELCEFLMDNGAKISKNTYGMTQIDVAADCGHRKLALALMELSSDK